MTTKPPSENEFSYLLTESLLTRKTSSTLSLNQKPQPLSHQQSIPKIVTSPPPNVMIIEEKPSSTSFNKYIGNHFKEDAPVFLDRLPLDSPTTKDRHTPNSTLWSYLSKDVHIKPLNNWQDSDSVFSEASYMASSPKFFSTGAFLFLFGFICPPCWWVGSFYPANVKKNIKFIDEDMKMELRWRLLNRFLSLGFSVLLVIAIIVLAIVYSKIN